MRGCKTDKCEAEGPWCKDCDKKPSDASDRYDHLSVVAGRTQAVAQISPLVEQFRAQAISALDCAYTDALNEAADQLEKALNSIEEMS
jgi:hypothetical protein